MIKAATFNANSIRSRIEIINSWLSEHQPQVLCIQETKVQDEDFPVEEFEDRGYYLVYKGQKQYNGVAIFSDIPIENAETIFPSDPLHEARFIQMSYKNITIVNTYIPQGQSINSEKFKYKLNWFSWLKAYFTKICTKNEPILWMGDFNVALEDIDVYEPEKMRGDVCFCPEVQQALRAIMQKGFVDVFRKFHPEPGQYSFWDYRAINGFQRNLGWRLDYIMASSKLSDLCTNCYIDKNPRGGDKPSDHTFVVAEFNEP